MDPYRDDTEAMKRALSEAKEAREKYRRVCARWRSFSATKLWFGGLAVLMALTFGFIAGMGVMARAVDDDVMMANAQRDHALTLSDDLVKISEDAMVKLATCLLDHWEVAPADGLGPHISLGHCSGGATAEIDDGSGRGFRSYTCREVSGWGWLWTRWGVDE